MPLRVTFVRHGQYNKETRELNRTGRYEAFETATRLLPYKFDHIVHGPKPRVHQTARIIHAVSEGRIAFEDAVSETTREKRDVYLDHEGGPWITETDPTKNYMPELKFLGEWDHDIRSVCFVGHEPNMKKFVRSIFPRDFLRRIDARQNALDFFRDTATAMTAEFAADEWSKIRRRNKGVRPIRMLRPKGREEADIPEDLRATLKDIAGGPS